MTMTTPDDKTFRTMLQATRDYGERVGRNAADSMIQDLWGGRQTSPAAARRNALAVVDDVCDTANRLGWSMPDLSGEWAGDPTPADVASACGLELAEDADDAARNAYYETLGELCSAWEDSAADGMFAELERSAAEFLASEEASR